LDIKEDNELIPNFLVPFESKIKAIKEQLSILSQNTTPNEDQLLELAITNLFYDLIGIFSSIEQ